MSESKPRVIIIGGSRTSRREIEYVLADLARIMHISSPEDLEHIHPGCDSIIAGDDHTYALKKLSIDIPQPLPVNQHQAASFREIPVPKKIGSGKGKKF